MKIITKDIEQLEVAGELIDKNSPTTSRLALFLLDNLAELMMYRVAMYEFAYDNQFAHAMPNVCKFTAEKKKKVIDHFKEKVTFLVKDLKRISKLDGIVLKVGHMLRNEAYHVGILREKIIIPFTKTYFQTVCNILPALWLGSYRYSSHEEVKKFLDNYKISGGHINTKALHAICSKILRKRKCKKFELAKTISKDLVERLNDTIDNLEYLAEDPRAKSPPEMLKWLQFTEDGVVKFGMSKSDEDFRKFWKMVDAKFASYSPNVTLSILKKWIKKAEAMRHDADIGILLDKFIEIDGAKPDKQFSRIQNLVLEAVVGYDEVINMQIKERKENL